MERPQRLSLVTCHLCSLNPVRDALRRIGLHHSHALPEYGFHIVLEQERGDLECVWKVQRGRKEVTDCQIEVALFYARSNHALYVRMGEFDHGKRCRLQQAAKIIQQLCY